MGGARTYDTAVRRWEGVGPYYAMFPTSFADDVVARYTDPGDTVLDPFAGRGTAVFSAAHQGRRGIGVEINPVGWVYAKAKLRTADKAAVAARLDELAALARDYQGKSDSLPTFFDRCFSRHTLEYLLAARDHLDWQYSETDTTTMALLLVYLHGKKDAALSNQMRQTKSMAPDYAVRWWQERDLTPPDLDPAKFLTSRLEWRYAKGVPKTRESEIHLGDSETQLLDLKVGLRRRRKPVRLLLTSPPYFALTDYHYDQWLRLWLLGGPPTARRVAGSNVLKGKFEHPTRYKELLQKVFENSAQLLARESVVYVRTGAGTVTLETTLRVMQEIFPKHRLHMESQPYTRPTQTSLFGDFGKKAGEVDIIMTSS